MFLFSILIGLILGLAFKGNFTNLTNVKFNGLYLVILAFGIEIIMKLLINFGYLQIGNYTLAGDVVMYLVLLIFVIYNRKDWFVVIMGIGFLLNAIAIFSNGGAMPVSQAAMKAIAGDVDPSTYGLYSSMTNEVNFWILCDTIYLKFIGPYVFSLGDIVSGLGIILLIFTGMRGRYNPGGTHSKGRSSRKNRRQRKARRRTKQPTDKEVVEIEP